MRRRWWLIGFTVLATAVTYFYYERQPKVYEASTKILLTAGANPLEQAVELSDRTIQDQADLLTSRDVSSAAAKNLGRSEAGPELARSITATVTPGSSFVRITARRPTASDAATVANAFGEAFIDLRTDAVRKRITRALTQVRAQLARLPRRASTVAERATLTEYVRQLQLTLGASSGSATQVDPALPPGAAVAPRPARSAMVALVLSLLGGIGLAFALEALDRRATRLEDLPELYGVPILAVLPHSDGGTHDEDGRASVDPSFKEPLRQLRTNLQLAALDKPFKRVLVTSAIAGEGKSTVVRNLAIVLREGGLSVAVVDGDLRRPALARLFKQDSDQGMTDVLTGNATLGGALKRVPVLVRGLDTLAQIQAVPASRVAPDVEHLASADGTISLLTAGPLPADPQTVLASDRTRQLLSELATHHDIVLIDSPPVLPVSDAITLASSVDAIIIVGRLGQVGRDNARRLAEIFSRVPDAQPLGLVVNDVPPTEGASYGYGYGY